jgi:hypothetical protein
VGQGFSVNAPKLAEGSQDVAGLLGRCEAIATDAVQAIAAMSGAAGHGGLATALGGAADQGTKAFLDLGGAYRHVASGLTAAASTYTQTEQDLVARSEDIMRGLL